MSRLLQYVNFVGVVALATLCFVQWKQNSQVNKEAADLVIARQEQADKMTDQEKMLKGNAADLDDLRQRLSKSESALKASELKLAAALAEKTRLVSDNEQAKASIAQWGSAIKQRDERLKEVNAQALKAEADRNDAVLKFNELYAKYKTAVEDLHAAQAKLAAGH